MRQRWPRDMSRQFANVRVNASRQGIAVLEKFRESFPNASTDACEVIKMLDEVGSPATVATTGGR
jgi:aromatic-L-amino-acid decarboxylase